MIIEEVRGERGLSVDIGDNVRSRNPAHTTPTDKLLPVGLSEAELKTTLLNKLAALTPFNITHNQILRNQLEGIRGLGWALT